MMEVYLDNSATTKITDNVKDKVIKALYEDFEILPLYTAMDQGRAVYKRCDRNHSQGNEGGA